MKWVSSGTSKGGETVIHNRRFYPNDVDGTIANVAPISISKNDTRYSDFLNIVGGEKYAECRSNLKKIQQILLENRDYYISFSQSEFKLMGSKENAFNLTVNELIGVFWQYTNPEDKDYGCNAVAEAVASRDDLKTLNLIGGLNDINNYDDVKHSQMLPYYIHSSYELGYPEDESNHIQQFFTKKYDITSLIPPEINLPYSNATTIDTLAWLEKDAQKILLVYGEFDAWTAGAVTKVKDNADNHRYVVKGGNHSAYFMDLPEIEKNEYISILSKWLNKTPAPALDKTKPVPKLEDELKLLRIRY